MSNFAQKMKAAKEAKKSKETIEPIEPLKAGDIIETDQGESFELDAEQASSLNEQIGFVEDQEIEVVKIEDVKLDQSIELKQVKLSSEGESKLKEAVENIYNKVSEELPVKIEITSTEIEIVSSEFHNFGNAIFEKNKPTFLTEKVLNDLLKLPNFKDLVDKGVIKIGL